MVWLYVLCASTTELAACVSRSHFAAAFPMHKHTHTRIAWDSWMGSHRHLCVWHVSAHAWIYWLMAGGVRHEVLNWPALGQTTRFSFAFNRNYAKCATPFYMILISNLYCDHRKAIGLKSEPAQNTSACIGFIIRISQWLKYCVRCVRVSGCVWWLLVGGGGGGRVWGLE